MLESFTLAVALLVRRDPGDPGPAAGVVPAARVAGAHPLAGGLVGGADACRVGLGGAAGRPQRGRALGLAERGDPRRSSRSRSSCWSLWVWVELKVPEPMVEIGHDARPRRCCGRTSSRSSWASRCTGPSCWCPTFVQMGAGLPDSLASRIDYGFGASVIVAGLFLVPVVGRRC